MQSAMNTCTPLIFIVLSKSQRIQLESVDLLPAHALALMMIEFPWHMHTLASTHAPSTTMAPPLARARMRGTSSCPRRPILYHLLLISLVCLKGTTTLAASSIPPLSVLNSRRVSAGDAAAAAAASTASLARDRRLAPFLGSFRGGAAAAAAVAATPVETQKGVGPMEIFLHTIKEARRHLAAAAVARSVSIFGMCAFMATHTCLDWCYLLFLLVENVALQ